MGFLDRLKGGGEAGEAKQAEREKEPASKTGQSEAEGKYEEECGFCGGLGTEKKWMGQYWHKKCLRQLKKQGKKMI